MKICRLRLLLTLGLPLALGTLFTQARATEKEAAALSAEQIANKIQQRYRSFEDLSAQFEQSLMKSARSSKVRSESGKLYLKKGGLMRWDYEKPERKNFIFDGEKLWFYKPDEAQAYVYDHFMKADMSGGLAFLAGQKGVSEEFYIADFNGIDPQTKQPLSRAIAMTPKKGDPNVKNIVFVYNDQWFIERALIQDHVGNYNIFNFKGFLLDQKLKREGFVFTPPAGVKLLHVD